MSDDDPRASDPVSETADGAGEDAPRPPRVTAVQRAYIGLGSNMGDRIANLGAALAALRETPGVAVVVASRVYETRPWGGVEQPAYANAVAALDVALDAPDLLWACKRIERELGRTGGVRFGPRPIDLDILLFGDERIDIPELRVPHPRLLEREFVVTPLLEIAPDAALPGGDPVTSEGATEGRIVRLLGALPGSWMDGS